MERPSSLTWFIARWLEVLPRQVLVGLNLSSWAHRRDLFTRRLVVETKEEIKARKNHHRRAHDLAPMLAVATAFGASQAFTPAVTLTGLLTLWIEWYQWSKAKEQKRNELVDGEKRVGSHEQVQAESPISVSMRGFV